MSEEAVGCARPTGATVGEPSTESKPESISHEELKMSSIKVGTKAPDFQAPAYYRGSFTSIKLSDFLGQWVMLCFYPGDFTFV